MSRRVTVDVTMRVSDDLTNEEIAEVVERHLLYLRQQGGRLVQSVRVRAVRTEG